MSAPADVAESTRSTRGTAWLRLVGVVLGNALLQTLLVMPAAGASGLVDLLTAIGSLIALVVAGVLAARVMRRGATTVNRRPSTARHRWRVVGTIVASVLIMVISWLIALLFIAFLPGPVAVAVTWLVVGTLACVAISLWVRLRRSTSIQTSAPAS